MQRRLVIRQEWLRRIVPLNLSEQLQAIRAAQTAPSIIRGAAVRAAQAVPAAVAPITPPLPTPSRLPPGLAEALAPAVPPLLHPATVKLMPLRQTPVI